jgi:hypothetical protein
MSLVMTIKRLGSALELIVWSAPVSLHYNFPTNAKDESHVHT